MYVPLLHEQSHPLVISGLLVSGKLLFVFQSSVSKEHVSLAGELGLPGKHLPCKYRICIVSLEPMGAGTARHAGHSGTHC